MASEPTLLPLDYRRRGVEELRRSIAISKRRKGWVMRSKEARMLRKQAANYRKAVKYLDGCGEMTLAKLRKAGKISIKSDFRGKAAVGEMEATVAQIWEQSKAVLPGGGTPGGTEYARYAFRQALEEGISTFESLADEIG